MIGEGVSKNDATSIINAFRRFCELPIGMALNWGCVIESGRKIDSLSRMKCVLTDHRVILYSIYLFAEKCNNYKEFSLAWMMNDSIERDGVSPAKIFGFEYEEMKSLLMGLSSKYPEYINASFTNDLDKISLTEKTSLDVINLFKEEK